MLRNGLTSLLALLALAACGPTPAPPPDGQALSRDQARDRREAAIERALTAVDRKTRTIDDRLAAIEAGIAALKAGSATRAELRTATERLRAQLREQAAIENGDAAGHRHGG